MPGINEIFAPIASDLAEVEALLRAQFALCPVPRLREIGLHVLSSGGKRVRPALALLMAGSIDCRDEARITVAAAVEMLHTASLMHDDVIDSGLTRRGSPTANALWGNTLAVLAGDFMYTRSFEMLAATGRMDVLEPLTHASNVLSQGEVLQLDSTKDYSEAHYFEVIERKTTVLFEAASAMVCALSGRGGEAVAGFTGYAKALGNAFQITDDVIDYLGRDTGKAPGADFAQGKITLPVICALEAADASARERLKEALASQKGGLEAFTREIRALGGFDKALARTALEVRKGRECLAFLEPSLFKASLIELLTFVSGRGA